MTETHWKLLKLNILFNIAQPVTSRTKTDSILDFLPLLCDVILKPVPPFYYDCPSVNSPHWEKFFILSMLELNSLLYVNFFLVDLEEPKPKTEHKEIMTLKLNYLNFMPSFSSLISLRKYSISQVFLAKFTCSKSHIQPP